MTYYQFQNMPDITVLSTLGAINNTAFGSLDNAFGTKR
jgi:hypothetical protein